MMRDCPCFLFVTHMCCPQGHVMHGYLANVRHLPTRSLEHTQDSCPQLGFVLLRNHWVVCVSECGYPCYLLTMAVNCRFGLQWHQGIVSVSVWAQAPLIAAPSLVGAHLGDKLVQNMYHCRREALCLSAFVVTL